MNILNVGKDFSTDPIGRFRTDGDRSGEAFREDLLKPKLQTLKDDEVLVIVIDDGIESYGSSFLSEGFAGLVKYGYFTKEKLLQIIDIRYANEDFEFFKNKIIEYINAAKYNSKKYEPAE
jgi:hypothetical protein